MQDHISVKKRSTQPPNFVPEYKKERRTHPLLKLQHTVGNRALLHLRRESDVLQTKLSVGQPNDMYEQEADQVARRIVNQISQQHVDPSASSMPSKNADIVQNRMVEEGAVPSSPDIHALQRQEEEEIELRPTQELQRQAESEEEEEEAVQTRLSEQIQRQEEDELLNLYSSEAVQRQEEEEDIYEKPSRGESTSGTLSAGVENQIRHQRQGGVPMDAVTRDQMQSSFGYDFSRVHIHHDSAADRVASQVKAEAFTLKNDIFFRGGRYDPDSTQGQDLLAHELTHVVQQGAAAELGHQHEP